MPGRLSSAKEILLLLLLGVAGQSFDSYSDLGLFYRFAVGKTYTSKFNDMPSPCIMRIPLLSGRFEKSSNIHLHSLNLFHYTSVFLSMWLFHWPIKCIMWGPYDINLNNVPFFGKGSSKGTISKYRSRALKSRSELIAALTILSLP